MKTLCTLLLLAALMSIGSIGYSQTPLPPTLLTATASFYYVPDIYISWRGPDNSVGSVAYHIYRSLGDTSHFQLVGTSYYGLYADYQILGGQVYYYYVTSNVQVDTTWYESDRSSYVNAIAVQQGGGGGGGGGSKRKNNGTIAGRVTDSLTTRPITAIQVTFYRVSSPGVPVQKLLTDGSGHYKAALDTGTYVFKAGSPLSGGALGYRTEWYLNASQVSDAQQVHVDDSSRIVADFDLVKPDSASRVTVSGMVMDSTGAPLKRATVAILRSIQDMEEHSSSGDESAGNGRESSDIDGIGHGHGVVWQGRTDSLGNYQAMVRPGSSYVVLAVKQGFMPQFFFHQSNPAMANALLLAHDTSGIDFNLIARSPAAVYAVSGTVADSTGVRVPSRIALLPVGKKADDSSILFSCTDSTGSFALSSVRAGKYFALALPFSLYGPAYYRAGAFGVSRWQDADTIVVSNNVTGIDIGVSHIIIGGINRINGRITSNDGPKRGASIYARFSNGSIAGHGLADENGYYSINGLPAEKLSLSTDLEGFQSSTSTLTIAPGTFATNGVDFTLAASVVSSVNTPVGTAREFELAQNYPNPFNPSTRISFTVGGAGVEARGAMKTTLVVYDVIGRKVATLVDELKAPGTYEVRFDGNGLASGLYIYRLTSGSFVETRKMMLLK